MSLGIVVTTLGRAEALDRLLASLDGRLSAGDRLVVVAQDRTNEVACALEARPGLSDVATVITSARGAALGRDTGVAALPEGDLLLCFPNDTTWFPPGTVEALQAASADERFEAGAMTVVDEHGPKFSLPPAGTPLDRWNVWSVIEMGLLVRRSSFDEVGGFDPMIGTGAPTPWQAGEATDLLLRLLRTRPRVAGRFVWLPPEVAVGGVADPHGLSVSERRRKLRAYGRGLGRLVVVHRYPLGWRTAFVVGGLAFGLRHRATNAVADGWWVFLGRLEGALGRVLGGPAVAVTR